MTGNWADEGEKLAAVADSEPEAGAHAPVVLPAGTFKRYQQLVQQRDAAVQRLAQDYQTEMNKLVVYALEALDVTGKIMGVDAETGVVTLEPLPAPEPTPINRADRRRQSRGK